MCVCVCVCVYVCMCVLCGGDIDALFIDGVTHTHTKR